MIKSNMYSGKFLRIARNPKKEPHGLHGCDLCFKFTTLSVECHVFFMNCDVNSLQKVIRFFELCGEIFYIFPAKNIYLKLIPCIRE